MNIRIQQLRILSFVLSCFIFSGIYAQTFSKDVKQGVLFVKIKENLAKTKKGLVIESRNGVATTGVQAIDRINTDFSVSRMKRVFPYSPNFEAKHQKHGLHLWYEVSYDSQIDPGVLAIEYKDLLEVDDAEPVLEKRLITGSAGQAASLASASNTFFNDPYLSSQWHYNNDGQTLENSMVGADINLAKAWEVETGKPNVIVNIVDGGFETDHEDLVANVWINEQEANGEAGVDDDGNGYVDDVHGYNFATDDGHITSHYHGTHVAGTVSATNDNGIGVSGVAGGSANSKGVRLMSSQIFTEEGAVGSLAAGLVYGADNGAVISQNSWGYNSAGYYEQVVLDAIDYFIEEAGDYEGSPMKGGIVIFAAGNDNEDGKYYPAYYDKVIAVSAMGADFKKASYSNFGSWVDVIAPGGETINGLSYGVLSTAKDNGYEYMDGTSMACPHVSGIAALVVSKFGGPDFTNEDLRTHLFTSLHNIDQYNPDYKGQLGLGYIDAFLALQTDYGIAPNKVTDLTLVGISQDFANLSWSIPTDEDDLAPHQMELYYHTEAITVDNLSLASKIEIDENFKAGELYEIEVTGLKSTTTYYFALRATDRWGNISDLSNAVSGTTNEGPDINSDVMSMSLSVDQSTAFKAGTSFNILNEAEGTLKWKGGYRHSSSEFSPLSSGLNYPMAGTIKGPSDIGMLSLFNVNRPVSSLLSVSSGAVSPLADHFYQEIYHDNGASLMVIGEIDTTITNSSATRFVVYDKQGFNLTTVSMLLKHNSLTGPMQMEIYYGQELAQENLFYSQEVNSTTYSDYWHKVQLEEQLYFEYGETFWIVFHVPSGNLYPLGVAKESYSAGSDNCLMSFDMGLTWQTLESAFGGDPTWAWTTTAISQNRSLDNYITLAPDTGVVNGFQQELVQVEVDGSKLINGDYKANVLIESNDKDEKYYRIPLALSVSGQVPVLQSDDVLEFGSVFHGHEKTDTITIVNSGYGNFVVQSVLSTDPQFEIRSSVNKIDARDQMEVIVTYKPDGAGNDNGTIELEDIYGHKHSVYLFGVGTSPAAISIDPIETQLAELVIGQSTTTSFNISNTGQYPLKYVISQFADSIEIEGSGEFHKFGYTVESNANGETSAVYEWEDISLKGMDITALLEPVLNTYYEVELGFDFPFYDSKLRKINITDGGALSLDQEGPMNSCSPPFLNYLCSPKGYISAFTGNFDLSKGGKIFYYRSLGSFIVQYQDMILSGEGDLNNTITFQIVLHYNGNIEFKYQDVTKINQWQLNNCLIAIGDREYEDVLIVNGAKNWDGEVRITGQLNADETIFRLKAPGEKMIASVSAPYGYLKVGETKQIDLDITTEYVYNGEHSERLTIFSNDPFNNPVVYTLKATVTGGVPDVFVEQDTIDLGTVFQGGSSRDIVIIRNQGTAAIDVSDVSVGLPNFIPSAEVPYTIEPKSSYYVTVDLNTAEKGVFEDKLSITMSDGQVYTVVLEGEVTPAPDINIDIASIAETLEAGDKVVKTISITNNGEAPLELVPGGSDWLYLNNDAQPNNVELKEFTYYNMDSNDEGGPAYHWEEIRDDGVHIPHDWYSDRGLLYQAIPLPFEFEFYNVMCDTMWLSWESYLTLEKPLTEPWYNRPQLLPDNKDPNGVIAPYWCPHNPDRQNFNYEEEVGVFYKFFDDRIVITWSEYIDFFGMGWPYSIQAILYKNGNIKFQYKRGTLSVTTIGVIGVENMDGTDGVQVSAYQDYIQDKLAVSLIPARKEVIEIGETKELSFVLDATYLNKGVYTSNIRILNNVPQKDEQLIPVSLTVNGEPILETVDTIRFDNAMVYDVMTETGLEPKTYYQEFQFKNVGRADIDFSRILLNNRVETSLEWQTTDIDNNLFWETIPRRVGALVPGESMQLRVALTPTGNISALTDSIRIISNLSAEDIYIPVVADVIFPPVNGTSEETITVTANDISHVETRKLVIDNSKGLSALEYALDISFMRDGVPVESSTIDTYSLSDPEVLSVLEPVKPSASVTSLANEVYNNTLQYDSNEEPYTNIGYGDDQPFVCSTAFTAPEAGFNLTHVQTWYNPVSVLNSKIKIEVRGGGTSINDARILTSQTVDVELENSSENGGWLTFELDENQIFYPGEPFYVVFKYQLGVANPQGLAGDLEMVESRFMYEVDGYWYDLQFSYPGWGWMVKAHEKESKGGAWATIEQELIGKVPAGETKELDVVFDASRTLEVDNKGQIQISTNDPKKPKSLVGLLLMMNQGPQYDFGGKELPLMVNENDTLIQKIYTWDREGDACAYELADTYNDVQMTRHNDTITFVYTPDFESAGLQSFKIVGEDSYGNKSVLDVEVKVKNVNRAPEIMTPITNRKYRMPDDENENFNLLSVFSDPDGEDLRFEVINSESDMLVIYMADNMMSLSPLTIGSTQVNVKATDPEGASVINSFIVDVLMRTGLDDNELSDEVSIYPNPVAEQLNVIVENAEMEELEIRLVNTLGALIHVQQFKNASHHECSVDMSACSNGLYYLQVQLGNKSLVRKIVKK